MTTPTASTFTLADFHAAIAAERRADRQGARMFADACAAGDPDALFTATDFLNENTIDGWRLAMRSVSRLPFISADVRTAFLSIWIESKMLALRVGDRRTTAAALRLLMPAGYAGPALRLYRGAGGQERRRRLYGFSWTSRIEVAREFAEHWQQSSSGGVVFETLAPPEAVLLMREQEAYYDEGEVVVDPYRLGRVSVVERLAPLNN